MLSYFSFIIKFEYMHTFRMNNLPFVFLPMTLSLKNLPSRHIQHIIILLPGCVDLNKEALLS